MLQLPTTFDLQRLALIWARCLPLFLLLPWLAFRSSALLLPAALSLAFACSVWPFALYAAALGPGESLWAGAGLELLRGTIVALGCALPFVVLAMAAGLLDGLRGQTSGPRSDSPLARAAGLAGLTVAASSAFLSGCARLLLERTALGAQHFEDASALRGLLRELAGLLLRAFELSVSFSAPVLAGIFCCALLFGLVGRVATPVVGQLAGPVLLPYFGLALLCLSAANWFDAIPDLVRSFAGQAARLLGALP